MAALGERTKKKKVADRILFVVLVAADLLVTPYLAYMIHEFLLFTGSHEAFKTIPYPESVRLVIADSRVRIIWLVLQLAFVIGMIYLYVLSSVKGKAAKVDTITVTDDIEIPVAVGNGQHGTARFATDKEVDQMFSCWTEGTEFTGVSGLVVHTQDIRGGKKIYYNTGSPHSLIIGMTGAGKTRRILLETIGLQILAGESVVCSDVKGELYYFTSEYAKEKDYQVLEFDLRNPSKSQHYNFLQPLQIAKRKGDIGAMIDATWDFVTALVKYPEKGEPIWYNGECCAIAASVLCVMMDAPPGCDNCYNVYNFLANMCQSDPKGNMPLNVYLDKLPDTHPAKQVFAAARIAPGQTRASFFTSALSTLRLFTLPAVAEMTSHNDFTLDSIAEKKTILYMMIPDEKATLYPLVSLFVSQAYMAQVDLANRNGTVLPVPVNYDLDELGNFPTIPVLGAMYSAGRSRGIRVNGVIQDYQQLESKYKDSWRNIKSNAELKLFLKSDDTATLKDLSDRIGTYTVETPSVSSSASSGKGGSASYSASSGMTGRPLLYPSDLAKMKAPYALVYRTGYPPVIGQLPDLSEYRLNEEFGLGDPEHNKRLMKGLEEARPARIINNELKLWSPWKSLWKGGKGIRERVQEQEHDKRFLNVEEKKRS